MGRQAARGSGRRGVRLGLVLCAVLAAAGCGRSDDEAAYRARKAELERRIQGMRELLAEAERGSLVPRDRFAVGVDERLLGALFASQLPWERPVAGVFVLRLESAVMRFHEKYGTVQIQGRMRLRPFSGGELALRLVGGLAGAEVDPETGVLRLRVAIDHIDLLEARGLAGLLGRGALNYLGGAMRDALVPAIPPVEVPVTLEHAVPIPAVAAGGVSFSALEVPLEVSVEKVFAAGGKLWVVFDAQVGPVRGGEGGLGVEIRRGAKPAPRGATP